MALTAATFCLTACSAQDTPPQTQGTSPQPEQAQRSADDMPKTTPTRGADGSLLMRAEGCKIYAQKAHGQIRWYTDGRSRGCEAWISDRTPDGAPKGRHFVDTAGPYKSEWFTAGVNDEVCVNGPSGQLICESNN
ncbi:hypothetical protein ACFIN9_18800 [Streptomyces noursei]|uniref:hypothetical protein n=1 Tax=Streptomyces noursei TaxID=1971 RepID=UPI0036D27AEF